MSGYPWLRGGRPAPTAPDVPAAPAATRRLTWRDFVHHDGMWALPDVDRHNKPRGDYNLEGWEAIAAYLDLPAAVVQERAAALRLPFIVPMKRKNLRNEPFVRDEWHDEKERRLQRVSPVTTAHALSLWLAANVIYASDRIATRFL